MKNLKNNFNGLSRHILAYGFSQFMPYYVLNEYPKSGATWIGQMISKGLDVPFPRNRFPVFRESIIHGHFDKPRNMKNAVCVWRDGRDVIVSWYYHCLFVNEHGNDLLVDIVRKDLGGRDWEDIYSNLPLFIEYSFNHQKYPRFTWKQFVDNWYSYTPAIHTSYEVFKTNPVKELQDIVFKLKGKRLDTSHAEKIVEDYSFKKQTGRNAGSEAKNSFLRKGIVGDWENQFSVKSRQLFNEFAGQELIILGYEKDTSWSVDGSMIKG